MRSRPRLSGSTLRLLPLLLAVTTSGCLLRSATYFIRQPVAPMTAVEVRMDPLERRDCLIVMLPGLFDIPDQFFDAGLVDDTARASDRCDLVVVDAHIGYYQRGVVTERLEEDVLRVAQARGYREIWLVGISMGALGALLLAREHPDQIRGLVLLSPWLGEPETIRAVTEAGGLGSWEPPPIDMASPGLDDATAAVLTWLRERDDGGPALYVGVGEDDRWREHAALLEPLAREEHTIVVEGRHEWGTWRRLWLRVLRIAPFG